MPRLRFRATALLAAGALAALPAALRAQSASAAAPRFLFLEAHGNYTRVTAKDADPQTGPGIGGEVGVMISPWFGVFAGLDVARLKVDASDLAEGAEGLDLGLDDHSTFRHVEAGVRFRLPTAGRFSPYADVGYSARRIHYESDYVFPTGLGSTESGTIEIEAKGDAPLVGLGFEAALSPSVALGVSGHWSFGKFDEGRITVDGESFSGLIDEEQPKVNAMQLRVGLRWYPAIGGMRR